jgi:hypothetical protein
MYCMAPVVKKNCARPYVIMIMSPADGNGLLNLLIANAESEATNKSAPNINNLPERMAGM